MDSLKLGFFDNLIHEATAAVITRVLEAHGITDIELITGECRDLTQELTAGKIDLFVSVWLPDIHADIIQFNPNFKVIGNLYQPSISFALPKKFQEHVGSIDQLITASFLHREITVCETLQVFANKIMKEYGLIEAGYQLKSIADEETLTHYQEIIHSQEPELMMLYEPALFTDSGNFYRLRESESIFIRKQKAAMLLNPNWIQRFGGDLIDELEEMMLGNQIVQFMENAIRNQGMSADEAAEAWQRGKLVVRA